MRARRRRRCARRRMLGTPTEARSGRRARRGRRDAQRPAASSLESMPPQIARYTESLLDEHQPAARLGEPAARVAVRARRARSAARDQHRASRAQGPLNALPTSSPPARDVTFCSRVRRAHDDARRVRFVRERNLVALVGRIGEAVHRIDELPRRRRRPSTRASESDSARRARARRARAVVPWRDDLGRDRRRRVVDVDRVALAIADERAIGRVATGSSDARTRTT